MKPHTQQFLQKRKLYMALPVLAFPFITMTFWALGGGQGTTLQASPMDSVGLNVNLPEAQFAEKEIWDKLSLYEMADRDSNKFEEARESDPYFDLVAFQTTQPQVEEDTTKESKLISGFKVKDRLAVDPNEEKVNRKLQELYNEISKPTPVPPTQSDYVNTPSTSDPQFTSDVSRLETLMESMRSGSESDPEMQQIDGVLEKILDIQHPERVQEKLSTLEKINKSNTLTVEPVNKDDNISLISSRLSQPSLEADSSVSEAFQVSTLQPNGFFGLEDETAASNNQTNAIQAVIHDTQELVAGSTVKMRLLNDIQIGDNRIPKDQLIYGICSINGERLKIEIASIRTNNSLLPTALEVYDLDGLEGVYIPGAITRDAAKQASDNALQNVQLMSLNPSLGAQAAAAGVEAAKGLFSKKAKLIKVTVKAGYQILLKDTSPNTQINF